ncbi:MAG: lipase [Agathobacter sp.]|nr:lipase [Agathobacter sp.]
MELSTTKHWCSIWGNAMSISENRPEMYAKDITLRYDITSPFCGNKIKLTFDNYCGTEPITLSKVTVLLEDHFYPVTFSGKGSVTISARGQVISDELPLNITQESVFSVSIYLGEFTQMRSSVYASGPLSSGLYAIGDQTKNPDISIDISRKTNIFYFLSNVSLYTDTTNRALICYGDSITAQDWPDYLALRCRNEGFSQTSIVRRATSGSRILREYSCITYESYGLKGTNRFEHEVPTEGADTVLIQQGINDIIHPVGTDVNPFRPMSDLPTLEELKDDMKWYIEKARSYNYKVYAGTLLPIYGWRTYAPFREELKNEFNNWLRTTDLLDGCIDFEAALRDPNQPEAFQKIYDSGDHLHPSSLGYKTMADSVLPELLR